AITYVPWSSSQHLLTFPQPPCERQHAPAGTTSRQPRVRKSTRLCVEAFWKYPTRRSAGAVESVSSVSTRSVHWTAAQVWKLLRIASYVSAVGASAVPCEPIWYVCDRVCHPRQTPELFFVRTQACAGSAQKSRSHAACLTAWRSR